MNQIRNSDQSGELAQFEFALMLMMRPFYMQNLQNYLVTDRRLVHFLFCDYISQIYLGERISLFDTSSSLAKIR